MFSAVDFGNKYVKKINSHFLMFLQKLYTPGVVGFEKKINNF